MLNVIFDPNLYLLFFAAYVVGFIDIDDPSGQHRGWGRVSDFAFWCGLVVAVVLFATHGVRGGAMSLLGAWAISVIGLRRGVLAQRNSLWETALWTTPLELLIARAAAAAAGVPEPMPAGVTAVPTPASFDEEPERVCEPRRRRIITPAREPQWRLPALASLLPGHGRRLTLLGIAMDMATCLVFVSALSLLAR